MTNKINNLYDFLERNRSYNKLIHIGEYNTALLPYNTTYEKVYALLHNIHNSQSQLKMDKSATFYKTITSNKINLSSFSNFITTLGGDSTTPITYKSLFSLLEKQPSWGKKTAALFTKAIYNCHIGFSKNLSFWHDAPTALLYYDELYLPVDAVIEFIFKEMGNPCTNSFWGINKHLKQAMPNSHFDIWDDLWYWGFITQNSQDGKRTLQWNENKYWNLHHSAKDAKSIGQVKELAKEFIKIIKQK